ncbi:MAG: hypothetical protein MUF34_01725 [Polyangiaceae bacterium]|nr:hypothetical protein [Polyangiaceae bacterium]
MPTLTLVAATSALLVGASPRSLVAVRVFGGPSEGPGPHALRLACVRRLVGVEDPIALEGLRVELEGQSAPASCDDAGHADLTLPSGLVLPRRPRVVVRQNGLVLAQGQPSIGASAWRGAFTMRPARAPVAATPARPFELLIPGGLLAVGQRANLRLWLRDAPSDAAPPQAQGLGAEAGALVPLAPFAASAPSTPFAASAPSAPSASFGAGRGWAFEVRPTFVQASLSFAPGPGDEARWQAEASLPVVAGAPVIESLASEGGRLRARLRSPSGRGDAYVRVVDLEGRRYGARVTLTSRSDDGWPEGELSAPAPPAGAPAWLVVSASVDGGPGVSLPLPPGDEPRDGAWVPDLLWADGLAEALSDEQARGRKVRWVVAALVASGALLEAWLLLNLQRARNLVVLAEGGPDDGSERLPLRPLRASWLALVVGVVWLGFVVVGILLAAGLG